MIYNEEELEHIEGKEIPKNIHYIYVQNQRSPIVELGIFTLKIIITYSLIKIFFLIETHELLSKLGLL